MKLVRRRLLQFVAGVAVLPVAARIAAAETYPSRPVTIVVPFAAGGGSDLLARLVAQRLEQRLGKPFLIENKPGAATSLAAMSVVRANPDGYTLLQGTSSTMAINVTMAKQLPYQPLKDLVPVALLSASPFFLVVGPHAPVKSVAELVALAKREPNALNYGSSGPGSMHHLSTELFLSMTGTQMTHVPYKSTPQAMNDLLGGQIQVLFGDATSIVPLIQQGQVRALAVSTADRSDAVPEVPTVAEAGVPGFETASWQMLVAPANTPRDIVMTLNREVHAIFSNPEVQLELSRRGMGPRITGTPEELSGFVRAEIKRWAPIVERAGVAASQ